MSCLLVAYLSANAYAIVKMRVSELARSRKHLLLYGVPFMQAVSLIDSLTIGPEKRGYRHQLPHGRQTGSDGERPSISGLPVIQPESGRLHSHQHQPISLEASIHANPFLA
jgi:hypothetical protein